MKKLFVIAALLSCAFGASTLSAQTPIADRYHATADRIITAAMADSSAWNRLAEMTDKFGSRLSGSESLERTIDWILAQMKSDGLQNVHGEKVMVPHWVRGEESASLISPRATALHMIGLGRSVGTPNCGMTPRPTSATRFPYLTQRP